MNLISRASLTVLGLLAAACSATAPMPRVTDTAVLTLERVSVGPSVVSLSGRVELGTSCPSQSGADLRLCGPLETRAGLPVVAQWQGGRVQANVNALGACQLRVPINADVCAALPTLQWSVAGHRTAQTSAWSQAAARACEQWAQRQTTGASLVAEDGGLRAVEAAQQVATTSAEDEEDDASDAAVKGANAAPQASASSAQEAAWDVVRRGLKNPASGQLLSARIAATRGSSDFLVVLDVVAQNSFGGPTRSLCAAAVRVLPEGRYQQCLLGGIANPTECFSDGNTPDRALSLMTSLFQRSFCP